jgi:hypothetical protein
VENIAQLAMSMTPQVEVDILHQAQSHLSYQPVAQLLTRLECARSVLNISIGLASLVHLKNCNLHWRSARKIARMMKKSVA